MGHFGNSNFVIIVLYIPKALFCGKNYRISEKNWYETKVGGLMVGITS